MLCDVEAIIYDFRCAPAITSHQPLYSKDEELSRWIMVSYGSADKIYILKMNLKMAKTKTKTARFIKAFQWKFDAWKSRRSRNWLLHLHSLELCMREQDNINKVADRIVNLIKSLTLHSRYIDKLLESVAKQTTTIASNRYTHIFVCEMQKYFQKVSHEMG